MAKKLHKTILKCKDKISPGNNYIKSKNTKEKIVVEITYEQAQVISLYISDKWREFDDEIKKYEACPKCYINNYPGTTNTKKDRAKRWIRQIRTLRRVSGELTHMFWPWAKYDW